MQSLYGHSQINLNAKEPGITYNLSANRGNSVLPPVKIMLPNRTSLQNRIISEITYAEQPTQPRATLFLNNKEKTHKKVENVVDRKSKAVLGTIFFSFFYSSTKSLQLVDQAS